MASKQSMPANGTTTPAFRRQASTAGANPVLTVALTPVPKVDYSVTKGGARTWIVLLVFFFLCSSLYTIFSAKDGRKEYSVNTHQVEDIDDSPEYANVPDSSRDNNNDDDDDDDDDDPPIKKTETISQQKQQQKQHAAPAAVDADDDDDDNEEDLDHSLGGRLFADLKKKISSRLMETEKVEKEKPKPQRELKKLKKRQPVKVVEEEEDDDDDEPNVDDDEEVRKEEVRQEVGRRRMHNKAKNDDDEEDEEEEKELSSRKARLLRRRLNREQRRENRPKHGKRECVHQDCPNFDSVKPRKSILMHKKKIRVQRMDDDDDDDEEDDEDDDDDDEEEKTAYKYDNDDDNDDDDVEQVITERAGSSSFKRHAITTKEEIGFRSMLDRADQLVEKHEYMEALEIYDYVLAVHPYSPRAQFGKARAFDIRGEIEANEIDRDRAIEIYVKLLQNPATPEALFRQAAQKLIERTRFRGMLHKTLNAHRLFIDRFPDEVPLQTDFAVTFVMMKRYEDARRVLRNALAIDPNNVIALAYYGYILKAHDENIEQGVALMRKSLKLADNEIKDPKFYYQLGHGLVTLGKKHEADAVYQKAAQMGVFMNAQQRSLYNIAGLTARPWWNMDQTPYTKFLKAVERQWATIRVEGMAVLRDCNECWLDHNQQLVLDGQWKYFPIMSEQNFIKGNCERLPQTCRILEEFAASSNASKSEMYFSVLSSGGQILPHCGPTNYHLQAHLGLVVPSEARIRVGNETKGWKSGKFIIFDDSFEHELQFDGASSSAFRLVLVLQLWHPEVQPHQRTLSFLS
ncbi:unnamed protein product [Caenorhabditis bovis]|uniref:Aspartyl/asparaginy/proline hydroxylase domain-containing protein n=1 Tax=Caenorhabditis bovis TaxID=2654633 RepID=A0A8S1FD43_9PELO|nr:unnamed protein product [Caenorhabditis bovis]